MEASRNLQTLHGFAVGDFPLYRPNILELIEYHRSLEDTPLKLSVWYDKDDPKDIKLLEVMANWPSQLENDLGPVEFESTADFPLVSPGKLLITFCSQEELEHALTTNDPIVAAVRESFCRQFKGESAAEVLFPADGKLPSYATGLNG